MRIPTRLGPTLAHPECNYYCAGDIHAITILGPQEATDADVRTNARQLGLEVVEILPAREVDSAAFQTNAGTRHWDGRTLQRHAPQPQTKGWIVRCRVAQREA